MKQSGRADSDAESMLKCELASDVLRTFGKLRFAATGWSMLPSLWPGETLAVERVDGDQVRIGDVVLVGREGRLCAHRVVAEVGDLNNPRWITQGDALPLPDRPVSESELLGRVSYVIRGGKCVVMPTELSAVDNLIAKLVRSSDFAARALVYLNRLAQTSSELVLPCQG
jgi:hypothetical protein